MSKTIIGTFTDTHRAEAATRDLLALGLSSDELSVLVSEAAGNTHFAVAKGTKLSEGAASGGAIGGTLGAVAAGLAAVSAIVIPGLGLLAAGPLVAALAGAGAGAATGGLVGGLIGLGVDEHRAKLVESSLADGHIVIGVQVDDSKLAESVEGVMMRHNADSLAS